jgi:hypothetical protein
MGVPSCIGDAVDSFSSLEMITALLRVCHAREQGKFTVLFDRQWSGICTDA